MPEQVMHGLELLVQAIEIVGASALVLGFVIITIQCFRNALRDGAKPAIAGYRKALGRVILIGLEILVAATIIKTITLPPTAESMGFLAIMVAIRTALGWTTVLEMSGHWPWQSSRTIEAKS